LVNGPGVQVRLGHQIGEKMRTKTERRLVGILGAGLLALAAGACSSSKSGNTASSATSTSVDLAALGTVHRASGTPIKVGFIYNGQTQTLDDRPQFAMAKATAAYANEYLGGVAGHPVQLLGCTDNLTPAGATNCANQMLAAKVPVVLASEPAQPAPVIKALSAAKVPYLVYQGADASLIANPYASIMTNPLAILAAPIKLAKENGVSKVALIYADVPAAAQVTIIGKPMFKKNGLELITTPVPLGTPDMTPQIQSALSAGAKQFVVVGTNAFCVSALKGLKTLGYTGKTVTNLNCLDSAAGKSISGGQPGVVVASTESLDASSSEAVLFQAVGAKFAPGTPASDAGEASSGYAVTMGFIRAMKDLAPADTTPAGIAAELKAMQPQTMPLLAGQTFQCNRKASSLLPSVCSNGAALITLTPTGAVAKTESFDAAAYLKVS
jgi:branched-chain amino acid transport system substrate-binding protein